jgi:hypothetical protein
MNILNLYIYGQARLGPRTKWLPDKSKGAGLRKTWRTEGKVFVMRTGSLRVAPKVDVLTMSTIPSRKG